MAAIALFPSVLGVRPGVTDAAERLRVAGHRVHVAEVHDGLVFDDYDVAGRHAEQLGYPELMRRALAAVEGLPDGFLAAGFSAGGAMAEHVATRRSCAGVVLLSAALPLEMLGAPGWPAGVPAQIHYTAGDPFRRQEWIDAFVEQVRSAQATAEVYDYPGRGHLFTDPSLPEEYDEAAAQLCWQRVLAFCAATG